MVAATAKLNKKKINFKMKNPYLRIISDVRTEEDFYLSLTKQATYTLQLGNLSNIHYKFLREVNPTYHKAISGTSEVFDPSSEYYFRKFPHFLRDYGVWPIENFPAIFYLRGGESFDKSKKEAIGNWWSEEECSPEDLANAVEFYTYLKPKFMVTHECPLRVARQIAGKDVGEMTLRNSTSIALDAMFEEHKPEVWIFGRYRKYFSKFIEGTHFVCLNEVPNKWCFIDFPKHIEGEIVTNEELDLLDHQNPDHPYELELGGS